MKNIAKCIIFTLTIILVIWLMFPLKRSHTSNYNWTPDPMAGNARAMVLNGEQDRYVTISGETTYYSLENARFENSRPCDCK